MVINYWSDINNYLRKFGIKFTGGNYLRMVDKRNIYRNSVRLDIGEMKYINEEVFVKFLDLIKEKLNDEFEFNIYLRQAGTDYALKIRSSAKGLIIRSVVKLPKNP